MKTWNNVTKLCTLFLVSLCVLVFSNSASAAAYRKWCTTWTTSYTDAGKGEDYLNSSSPNIQRPARYTRVILWDNTGSPSNYKWSGFLDENGCTPSLTLIADRTYYLGQATYAANGTKEFLVNDDNESFDNTAVWVVFEKPVPTVVDGTSDQFTFYNTWVNPKANIMGVVGQILRYPDKIGTPNNSRIRFKTNYTGLWPSCIYQGAYAVNGDICLTTGTAWQDTTNWKYIVSHEVGHAITYLTQGPDPTGVYTDYFYNTPLCCCNHIGGYGQPESSPQGTHCLQSKESIKNAQGEGFANFAAVAVMNTRTYKDGIFVYGKPTWVYNNGIFSVQQPPVKVLAYRGISLNQDDQWLDRRCDGINQPGAGVELDWQRFFFETWTHGSSVFSADDMHYIWRTAGSNVSWANLQNVVNARWGTGSDKANWFASHGDSTGVSPY